MEQQQCPICMLYLLPGMNLQDHLDTHPKDMIIKALLSVKTQPPKPPVKIETAATVFLTTTSAPFNPSPQAHIYQEQQQNQLQSIQSNNFALTKRNISNNNINNNTVLFNNRPYRLTLDAPPQTVSSTPQHATTFLNSNSNYGNRSSSVNVEGDLFDNKATAPAFRCIQNTEQKNIMIVNTSSTQFIQQTLPAKKAATTAIELHPVIIDSSGMPINPNNVSNAISIIPRYTSEKYSGPPPSYSSAISSVTNTLNDKQPRVIDLTQTPTISTMKLIENKNGGNNNNNINNNIVTTLSHNEAEENRRLLIRAPPKILEYTRTENGDYMITQQLMSSDQPPTSQSLSVELENEEEVIEEIPGSDDCNYSIKYVDIDNHQMTFDITGEDEGDDGKEYQEEQEQYMIEESDDVMQEEEEQEEEECMKVVESEFTAGSSKNHHGVKVLSNVKLTSSEMFSPSIKDIIQQYNNNHQTDNMKKEEKQQHQQLMSDEADKKKNDEPFSLIHCTETLSLGKEKDESMSACTSVIRKTTIKADSSSSSSSSAVPLESSQKDEPQPSTSGCVRSSTNVVFNLNPTNRLKIRQPKKLIVKLKKPLVTCVSEITTAAPETPTDQPPKKDVPSSSSSSSNTVEEISIKSEVICEEVVIVTEKTEDHVVDKQVELIATSCKMENQEEHFDTSFLDHQNDYEHTSTHTNIDDVVSPEIHHDCETNQSLMSMDLEPETNVKREKITDDFPVIIKTELNTCSTSSTSSQSSSCSNSSPGPSRLTIGSSVMPTNKKSPLNFLYQNDRGRFSPPLAAPYVYLKTYSSTQSNDQPKQEADITWTEVDHLAPLHISDHNSTSSRYTPSFDDNRSNYTDLDGCNNKTSSSIGDGHIRAPSIDSLNIRTDEKMPARGEISEQESNGEIEQPWHHPFFQLQAYPSSYDMSTAQECWNLSKADSQNACDSNAIQNVIINFPSLNAQNEDIKTSDLLKSIMQTVTKQEPAGIDDEASGSNSNLIVKRNRTFRCPECSKFFVKLRARNRHIEQVHPHLRRNKKIKAAPTSTQTSKSPESSVFPSSSSALVNWTATATTTTTTSHEGEEEEEKEVKLVIKNEPSTSAAVLVKNEMNRMLISTTGSIKMEMDRLLLEPSTSSSMQLSTLGLKIKRTYMCAKCHEQFRTLKLLDKHFQIHPAECTLCQKTFNSWNTFSLHLKHHLNIRVHACRFCPKRFVQRQRLVEHERVHTGSMPIKCPHCDERFRRYSNMLHHRARVHLNKKAKQEDFVCDCGEIYQTKAKLEWHQETHENKPKPCPYCRERFTHRNSLTRHIRLSHTDKYVFAKSKAVNCPTCSSTYLPSSIKAHMATHEISNKEYSCSICSKQFSTKWNLKQHHWTHANRSTKPFQCNVCPSAFVRETDYTTHMNAHRSIKPFTCNTCGKRFVRKYNWLRHSREHEREKKFECETCKKKFHRAYYLTEHKRVHTGERPFSCTICGKTSATKTNHNKHIKIHHARDPLTAEG